VVIVDDGALTKTKFTKPLGPLEHNAEKLNYCLREIPSDASEVNHCAKSLIPSIDGVAHIAAEWPSISFK